MSMPTVGYARLMSDCEPFLAEPVADGSIVTRHLLATKCKDAVSDFCRVIGLLSKTTMVEATEISIDGLGDNIPGWLLKHPGYAFGQINRVISGGRDHGPLQSLDSMAVGEDARFVPKSKQLPSSKRLTFCYSLFPKPKSTGFPEFIYEYYRPALIAGTMKGLQEFARIGPGGTVRDWKAEYGEEISKAHFEVHRKGFTTITGYDELAT